MSEIPGVVITGASGRMGRMLIDEVLASDKLRLIGALERDGHGWVGQDLGTALGCAPLDITVTADPLEAFRTAQAVIDFTTPDATVAHAKIAAQARLVHVIGTTGFADTHLAAIEAAARHATIVRAG
ncbi:MAG: 4-hydroxy-tetrahydrodipicolinate reductase, partial [Pseudomonadota bacterium]